MASIGLRYPVYAPLTENEEAGTFQYGNGKIAAKAINVEMNINIAESILYADDTAAESIKEFIDGTLTFTADDLDAEVRGDWLGNTTEKVSIGEEEIDVLVSTDEDMPGYFGFGFIVPKIKNNTRLYRAIIFPKIQFKEPNESAETKGQQINWQTPQIEGRIFRRVDGVWKKEITVNSLATAKAWLAQELNIAAEGGGEGGA